jgi:hypothetical protein
MRVPLGSAHLGTRGCRAVLASVKFLGNHEGAPGPSSAAAEGPGIQTSPHERLEARNLKLS